MSKKQTAQAPTAQHATGGQEAYEPVIVATAFHFLLIAFFFLLFSSSLAEELGKKQAAHAPPAQHAAGDQEACEVVIVAPAFRFFLVAFFFVFTAFSSSLAEELGQKQTAYAPPAQHAAGDQEAHEMVIVAAAFGFFLIAFVFFLFSFFSSLAEELGEKQTAHAPPA